MPQEWGPAQYRISFPTYNAHNLLFGTMRTEVGGEAFIHCAKSGLRVELDFHQVGLFTSASEQNRVTGKVVRISSGDVLAELDGHWDSVFTLRRANGKEEEFLNVETAPMKAKRSLPPDLCAKYESRRLWKATTAHLTKRPTVDWDEVTRAKAVLEDEQRALACHRHHKGDEGYVEWKTKFFHKRDQVNPVTGEVEQVWTFDHIRLTPYEEGEPELSTIAISRAFPDPRAPHDAPPPLPASPAKKA
jgi:hypothetical protein